jgi:hypothetical protein
MMVSLTEVTELERAGDYSVISLPGGGQVWA